MCVFLKSAAKVRIIFDICKSCTKKAPEKIPMLVSGETVPEISNMRRTFLVTTLFYCKPQL